MTSSDPRQASHSHAGFASPARRRSARMMRDPAMSTPNATGATVRWPAMPDAA